MEVFRSLMFTPGQRQKMIDKSLAELNPDVLIFDFEDAVPPEQKDLARELVAEALRRPRRPEGPDALFVRVNSSATGRQLADMRAVVGPNLDGILLPKVEYAHEVVAADQAISELEQDAGLERGKIRLFAAIESARGIHEIVNVAFSSPRLLGLMFGAEDYVMDLGLPVVRRGAAWELIYARSALINAATMARLYTMDQVYTDFRDPEGERQDAIASRQLGFTGKGAIHPSQIPILNEVFSPTPEEVELAQRVIAAFEEARTAGLGCVMFGGQVVERPILLRAQRTLRAHEAIQTRKEFVRPSS